MLTHILTWITQQIPWLRGCFCKKTGGSWGFGSPTVEMNMALGWCRTKGSLKMVETGRSCHILPLPHDHVGICIYIFCHLHKQRISQGKSPVTVHLFIKNVVLQNNIPRKVVRNTKKEVTSRSETRHFSSF